MAKKLTALVYDSGDFVHFAQAISASFDRVLYFSSWMSSHPHQRDTLVGDLPGIARVNWFWKYIDQADVIVFLDCGDGDLITWLRKKGYRVWGCGLSDNLELDRANYRRVLDRIGLATVPAEIVNGIDDLEKFLQKPENENRYIKCSFFRGDFETYHHENWFLSQVWFEETKRRLGPGGNLATFICEEEISGVEPGYDGYSVDGEFPSVSMWGWEYKDHGYVVRVQPSAQMPSAISIVDALGPDLKMLGMRGNFHTEQRIADNGEVYITDPCTRLGSPPGEIMGILITNWADIIYRGAAGEIVDPEVIASYAAQIIKESDFATDHFMSFDIPPDFVPFFRFRRAFRDKAGVYWHIPNDHHGLVGSAIGFGDSPQEAIQMAVKVADAVKGYELTHAPDAEEKLLELIQGGEDVGLSFRDKGTQDGLVAEIDR